jgi:DNA mismatch repair protein MutS
LTEVPLSDAPQALDRLEAAELLLPDDAAPPPMRNADVPQRKLPAWHFDSVAAARALARQFGTQDLAAFGVADTPLAVGAAGALLGYAGATQLAALAHVRSLEVVTSSEFVALDPATRRNLEITTTLAGESSPTLHSLLDACGTAAGSRLLRAWLTQPLRDAGRAAERHAAIDALVADGRARIALAGRLRHTSDIERIAARIALMSARPRELGRTARHAGRASRVARLRWPRCPRRCCARTPPRSTSTRRGVPCSPAR